MGAFLPQLVQGGIQAVAGTAMYLSGNKKQKQAFEEREANLYQTPDEIYDVMDFAKNQAGTGLDALTMQYLTNQVNRSATGGMNTVERLGGNLNDIGGMIDRQIEGLMQVGAKNQQQRFANFSQYVDALKTMGQHKDAEWADKTNLIKDKLQAATQEKMAGLQSLVGAGNTVSGAFANKETMEMWGKQIEAIGKSGQPGGSILPSVNTVLNPTRNDGLFELDLFERKMRNDGLFP